MRWTRRMRLLAAGAVTATALVGGLLTPVVQAAEPSDGPLTDLVNPFIGTENEGNTYPGAAVPFGMVQFSPDTGHNTGYDYSDDEIRGFSTAHISGVGCGLGGDLPVLPTVGDITETDNEKYAVKFSHDNEKASPGYYQAELDNGVNAELTATERTGVQRYTFPATDKANVLLNAGQSLHETVSTKVEIIDDQTVRTAITGKGFCQDTVPYTLYTVTHFDRPFTASGTWKGDTVSEDSTESSNESGGNGAYVRFDTSEDQTVEATTAVSHVDAEGADGNLQAEGGRDFDSVADSAQQSWEERLGTVTAQGGSETERRTFYSSLYRSFLAPNIGNDVDGRYTGYDQKIHRADGFTYYQTFSLWDTYRTQTQLLTLLAPKEARDMALSVLQIDEDSGWLPKWGYGTVETNIMTGDPVTPFLTNAYQQGLLEGHEERAYQALKKNADGTPPKESPALGREANEEYLADGFAPFIKDREHVKPGDSDYDHGASATLEYALSDAMLGEMAADLGHADDAQRYGERARSYRNLFDESTGFFRARDAAGDFTGPADPAESEGFHEGTAWQYQWLVPQDLPDMVSLIGGQDATNERLDSFFAYEELLKDPAKTAREVWVNGPYDYYNADKYNPQNEPDLIAPYTYLSTGQPWKTTDVVHAALTLFTDEPTGMTGNDDLGTMSAWHVLTSIGIFPVQPGTDTWGLSTPAFESVELDLDPEYYPNGKLTVQAPGTSDTDRYIQSASTDGESLEHTYLTTDDLRGISDLSFEVGDSPSEWGTSPDAAPPALN